MEKSDKLKIQEKTESQPAIQTKPQQKYKWYIGGVAGSVASSATHPLDLLKVRLQVAKTFAVSKSHPTSLLSITKTIFKEESVFGFYRGLTASVMRQLTYSSLRFNFYFVLKQKLIERSKNNTIGFIPQMGCACISGAMGALAGNVFDLINIRMQSNSGLPLHLKRHYRNAFHGLAQILRLEGPVACFTGLATNMQRAVIITIAQIVSYERSKGFLLNNGLSDGIFAHFLASMISGLVTVTVSNPVDVVKSVLMSSPPDQYKSGLDCAAKLLSRNGPFYFMRGWLPSYVRLGPHTVVTFIVLEQLKKLDFFKVKSN